MGSVGCVGVVGCVGSVGCVEVVGRVGSVGQAGVVGCVGSAGCVCWSGSVCCVPDEEFPVVFPVMSVFDVPASEEDEEAGISISPSTIAASTIDGSAPMPSNLTILTSSRSLMAPISFSNMRKVISAAGSTGLPEARMLMSRHFA